MARELSVASWDMSIERRLRREMDAGRLLVEFEAAEFWFSCVNVISSAVIASVPFLVVIEGSIAEL